MPCLYLTPQKTITNVEPEGDFLEWLRDEIGCQHIESAMMAPHLALWVDAFGLYRKDQKYWQFDSEAQAHLRHRHRYRRHRAGLPGPAQPGLIPELFLEHVDWNEDVTLEDRLDRSSPDAHRARPVAACRHHSTGDDESVH